MESSNTGKTRAERSEPFVRNTSPKRREISQSAAPMEAEDPQAKGAYNELFTDDSSSGGSVDDYEEEEEIDPEDSISNIAKQPPAHRTKDSASHRTYYSISPREQHSRKQKPQSVPSSLDNQPGGVGSQVFPYPYNGFLGPGPQGVAGWVPPPAGYYGMAGYMPPNQDPVATPYWQRLLDEKGKEMMSYQMWNPFAPAQGAGPPPVVSAGKKDRRDRKRSLQKKQKHRSIQSLGAKPRQKGPAADQGRLVKVSVKSGNDAAILRLPADIDAVYNSVDAKDFTVHLELHLFRDVDEELEDFNRLARMGNCAAAESLFESHLKEHMSSDPSIIVQYAEMLLEKGDFKSLLLLDGDSVFRRRRFPGRNDQKFESKEPIEMNWMLIRAVALLHTQHQLHMVWSGIEKPLNSLSETTEIGSTEASFK